MAGRAVPGEVSVAGFDDMEEARSFWPSLTAVRQDFAAVGRLSVRKLLTKVAEGQDTDGETTLVPTELVIRDSTAPSRREP